MMLVIICVVILDLVRSHSSARIRGCPAPGPSLLLVTRQLQFKICFKTYILYSLII